MKKPEKEKGVLSLELLGAKERELAEQISVLEAQRKEIRTEIESQLKNVKMETEGVHFVFRTGEYKFVRQARETVKMKVDAVSIFKKFAQNAEKYITEVIDAKALKVALKDKAIEEKHIADLTESTVSYVLYVKNKDDDKTD